MIGLYLLCYEDYFPPHFSAQLHTWELGGSEKKWQDITFAVFRQDLSSLKYWEGVSSELLN